MRAALRKLIREHGGPVATARALGGITHSAVSQIDSEKNAPSLATALLVAKASGVTLSSLLGES